jgi:hypothetical protein
MQRVPVISPGNTPLMPAKASRARRWVRDGKAVGKFNDLGIYYVQLKAEPSDYNLQPIAVGIDPGKLYSGVAVQSKHNTLWTGHLELPFEAIKRRMENRRMLRRGRRGRRINRKVAFCLRNHRQVRFSNRKKCKIPPSIKANRQLELRVIKELLKVFPIYKAYYEYVKADVDLTSGRRKARSGKGFSPVMVGQKWAIKELEKLVFVETKFGCQTALMRTQLGLEKTQVKSEQSINSHAVDGIALACHEFLNYETFHTAEGSGKEWVGSVGVTKAPFAVVKRPPFSRRELHKAVPKKGGIRGKYGGSVTESGLRKGDLVNTPKGVFYIGGQTGDSMSLNDSNWTRIAKMALSKVKLLRRSNGLILKLC